MNELERAVKVIERLIISNRSLLKYRDKNLRKFSPHEDTPIIKEGVKTLTDLKAYIERDELNACKKALSQILNKIGTIDEDAINRPYRATIYEIEEIGRNYKNRPTPPKTKGGCDE